ncbi:pyrimidine 2 [Artemisia annua]|uniref:Pyrimidine 2 n=1 Tax=Artemisia annua TaxID=35608 RepID=A0A2U1LTH4_ARTAN|nr:pyrimidine 2 [Artemisia annua]
MEKPTEGCVPCMPYAVVTLASVTGINQKNFGSKKFSFFCHNYDLYSLFEWQTGWIEVDDLLSRDIGEFGYPLGTRSGTARRTNSICNVSGSNNAIQETYAAGNQAQPGERIVYAMFQAQITLYKKLTLLASSLWAYLFLKKSPLLQHLCQVMHVRDHVMWMWKYLRPYLLKRINGLISVTLLPGHAWRVVNHVIMESRNIDDHNEHIKSTKCNKPIDLSTYSLLFLGSRRYSFVFGHWFDQSWLIQMSYVLFFSAKLFNIYPRKGTLLAGSDADIIIFNPTATFHISAKSHHSRSDTNVYEGRLGKLVDLKRKLGTLSYAEWDGIPEIGDYSLRNIMPDTLLEKDM